MNRTYEEGSRDLEWAGCHNVRDLGGLPVAGGGTTPRGRVVRADTPDRLTPEGWAALWDYGVRTIIDLRRVDECAADVVRPAGLALHRVSWDDYPDAAWNEQNPPPGLPGSMRVFLRDFPNAVADTARVLIDSAPGTVLVHCAGGRDRTGLFAIILGALAGVGAAPLYDDYVYSFSRLLPVHRELGLQSEVDFVESPDSADHRDRVFGLARSVIGELDAVAAEQILASGGLAGHEIAALRARVAG